MIPRKLVTEPTTLDAALDYAARGWHVFPLKPQSKEPATRRGFYDATTNPEKLRRWFARGYPYNIGIRTGTPSGIFIFDADGETGARSLRELECKYEPFPQAPISTTGKGRHFWFKTDAPIPCSVGKVAPDIDIRGDGGYVVAPPSIHPNGCRYDAIAPDWLVQVARKKPHSISERAIAFVRRAPGSSGAYGRAALDRETAALAGTPIGSRNDALNRAAFSPFQLVAGGELDEREVLDRLIQAANACGLMTDPDDGPNAVKKTIESGRRAGMQSPRRRSGGAA